MKAAFGGDAARNERRQTSGGLRSNQNVLRKRSFVFDLLEGEARSDVGDATRFRQPFDDEMLEFDGVADNHAQKIIRVAGHQVTFHHLGKAADGLLEAFQHLLDLLFECDLNENAETRAQLAGVQKGHAARDDAGVLKRSDASKTWRRRQADSFSQRDIREAGVLLNFGEDADVGWIKSLFQQIMP